MAGEKCGHTGFIQRRSPIAGVTSGNSELSTGRRFLLPLAADSHDKITYHPVVGAPLRRRGQTAGPVAAPDSSIIAAGAKLGKLAGDFKFTEGPTADQAGNVFFTDQPNDRILKWSVDGKLSTFLHLAGRANGMFFDAQGNLIACADEKTELWAITPEGRHTVLAREYAGKKLNGPNDVWVRADGSLFFTDPFYKRDWWDYDKPPQGTEQVYFLSADRKTLKRVTTDLVQPNGIIGTPDGKKLFVSDIRAGKTYSYDIQPDGSLENKKLRCELGLRRHHARRRRQSLPHRQRGDGV